MLSLFSLISRIPSLTSQTRTLHADDVVDTKICLCYIWIHKSPVFIQRQLDNKIVTKRISPNSHCIVEYLRKRTLNWKFRSWPQPLESWDEISVHRSRRNALWNEICIGILSQIYISKLYCMYSPYNKQQGLSNNITIKQNVHLR